MSAIYMILGHRSQCAERDNVAWSTDNQVGVLEIGPRRKQILGAKIGSDMVTACAAVRHTAKR
jgi:hypothetical protein